MMTADLEMEEFHKFFLDYVENERKQIRAEIAARKQKEAEHENMLRRKGKKICKEKVQYTPFDEPFDMIVSKDIEPEYDVKEIATPKKVKKKTIKDYEKEVLSLVKAQAKYERNLFTLNPSIPKQRKKMVKSQFEIRKIKERLNEIQSICGIVAPALKRGPIIPRVLNKMKNFISTLGFSVRKFFKKHAKSISGIVTLAALVYLPMLKAKITESMVDVVTSEV